MKRVFVLLTVLLMATSMSFASSFTGDIVDQKCANGGKSGEGHASCAKNCIKGGQPAVLVTADGKIYELDKQEEAAKHAGHNVTVTGTEADGKIAVEKITM